MSDKSGTIEALRVAGSAIGGGGVEKLHALVKIRSFIVADDTINGTEARNRHPAFQAVIESLHEVKEPNLVGDVDANEAGKYAGVLSASNLVGIVASLERLVEELKASGKSDADVLNDPDVKCIVSQCRNLCL